jgi:hypothetical protein
MMKMINTLTKVELDIIKGIYCNLGYSTNLFSIPSIETIIREYNMHNKELKLDQKLIKP